MLPYFPNLYPDELLYSGLARFGRHTGKNCRAIQLAAFGFAHQVIHSNFGFRIGELTARVAHFHSRSVLRDHTLFPYLTALVPTQCIEELEKLTIAGDRQTCRQLVPLSQTFRKEEGLHYCAECLTEAEAKFGERYWRRVHQLPLVRVCPDHGLWLHVHRIKGIAELRRFHPALPENTNREEERPSLDEATRAQLQRLAKQSQALLEGNFIESSSSRVSGPSKVNEILAFKNYAFGPGRSSWRLVYEHAEQRLRWMHGLFPLLFEDNGSLGPWLKNAGTLPDLPTEVWQLADEILHSLPTRTSAFGRGPWPCKNPLAQHFERPVIKSIRRVRTNNVTQATFECDCGYIYTRQEKNDGSRSKPCFNRFGPMLRQHIQNAVLEGWTITKTAKLAGLEPGTLRRAMRRENIEDQWKPTAVAARDAKTGRFTGSPAVNCRNKGRSHDVRVDCR